MYKGLYEGLMIIIMIIIISARPQQGVFLNICFASICFALIRIGKRSMQIELQIDRPRKKERG